MDSKQAEELVKVLTGRPVTLVRTMRGGVGNDPLWFIRVEGQSWTRRYRVCEFKSGQVSIKPVEPPQFR